MIKHGEPDSILTDCAKSRRERWLNATSQLAYMNLARLQSVKEDDAKAREEFFYKLNHDPKFAKIVRQNMDSMMPDTFERKTEKQNIPDGPVDQAADDLIKMAPKGHPEETVESKTEAPRESRRDEAVEDTATSMEAPPANPEVLIPQASVMTVH